MKPTLRFLLLLVTVFVISFIEIIVGTSTTVSMSLVIILFSLAVFDNLLLSNKNNVELSRQLVSIYAINKPLSVILFFNNRDNINKSIAFYDDIPGYFKHDSFPQKFTLAAQAEAKVTYQIVPERRGDYVFSFCDIAVTSRLGLVEKKTRIALSDSIKIYPDYMPVIEYAMLKTGLRTPMMGIHSVQKRGDGLDFLELREYREGDSLRQIDWKTTSRLNKTISREYQVEQDQSFIFLLDCSHRMNAKDNDQTHFDHVLNAMLLTSYLALKQGDAVGYIAFGLEKIRWQAPVKGMGCFNLLLSQVYNIQPTKKAADYLQLAQAIPKLHNKNATLILLTNLRDNDGDEINKAITFLSKRYQVILASIKEKIIEDIVTSEPTGFEQALTYTAAIEYQQSRQRTLRQLHCRNIQMIDILADKLAISLANEYLKFKSK